MCEIHGYPLLFPFGQSRKLAAIIAGDASEHKFRPIAKAGKNLLECSLDGIRWIVTMDAFFLLLQLHFTTRPFFCKRQI